VHKNLSARLGGKGISYQRKPERKIRLTENLRGNFLAPQLPVKQLPGKRRALTTSNQVSEYQRDENHFQRGF